MSPSSFPERARKSYSASNHFPSCGPPFISVPIFPRFLLLLPFPSSLLTPNILMGKEEPRLYLFEAVGLGQLPSS